MFLVHKKWRPFTTLIVLSVGFPTKPLPAQTGAVQSENSSSQDALHPEERHGRWGFADSAGHFVIPPKYFAALPFQEGLALVVTRKPSTPLGSEYGEFRLAQVTWINRTGGEIRAPISVRRAGSFANGLALVVPDASLRFKARCTKGGYMNTSGQWAIKPQFDDLREFSDGMGAVNLGANCGMGGRWGYINRNGDVIIPYRFMWAGQFHNGHACVSEKQGEMEMIDKTGAVMANEKC
jgi:WG containing repeat